MNYYKQGNKEKADQIKAAFEAKGCVMRTGIQCDLSDMIYYSLNGNVGSIKLRNLDLFKTHPDYQELEQPAEPHYDISNFHAGMPVLVRPDNDCCWDYSVFSRNTGNEYWHFAVCNGFIFTQCIPFEGNEHLLGTTDMCDEQYINW